MPVSVNAVLRESLAETGHTHHLLQSQISSGTKHLVLKTIEYEEYPENFLAQNDALKAKYILLSSSSSSSDKNSATGNGPSGLVKKTLASPASHQNGVNGSGKCKHGFSLARKKVRLSTTTPSPNPFVRSPLTLSLTGHLQMHLRRPRRMERGRRRRPGRSRTRTNCRSRNEPFSRARKSRSAGRGATASGPLALAS